MRSGPPRSLEALVALLVPPACREEIAGDLHERYRSTLRYFMDALQTVPLVILSRIRRTTDAPVLTMHAFALYLSFVGAAWLGDRALLTDPWGQLRLSIPAVITLLGIVLDDAYAAPGRRSPLRLTRGPALGLLGAILSQEVFRNNGVGFALPRDVVFYGCGMSFLLCCAIRLWFPPIPDQLQGASAPAHWLKRAGDSAAGLRSRVPLLKILFALVPILLVLFAAYRIWKQA